MERKYSHTVDKVVGARHRNLPIHALAATKFAVHPALELDLR